MAQPVSIKWLEKAWGSRVIEVLGQSKRSQDILFYFLT